MANEEQLAILRQGVEVWNKWREEKRQIDHFEKWRNNNYDVTINLVDANLNDVNLIRADLSGVDLRRASLTGADLSGAILQKADLSETYLTFVNLTSANLSETNLSYAHMYGTTLTGADLRGARLIGSNLNRAEPRATNFGDLDLSETIGLEDVVHQGPSTIGTDTFAKSRGKIPEIFLRGCGLSDWEIEEVKLYNPDLNNEEINNVQYKIYDLRATRALQISPLFISYSHANSEFVDKLENKLNKKGIRFWRDIHDMKSGRMEKQIDRAIHQNPTVLLILSKHSLASDWVEHEVRTARQLEKDMGRDVLCPVALDDSWKNSSWPKRTMEQIMEYNILDFSEWEDDVKFEGMFRKLIDGLQLFYKG